MELSTEKKDNGDMKLSENGLETKLQELKSMKEKGLITQEEFQQLRKKALGL